MHIGQTRTNRNYATTYRSIRFYDRALSADEVKANADADGTLSKSVVTTPDFISVAQPVTNVIGDVSLTRRIGSKAELDAMMAAEQLPSAAIYSINKDLELLGDDGAAFATLAEMLVQTEYSVLPILIPADSVTVTALQMYADQNYFTDFCTLSADPALVNEARTVMPASRGMLDLTAAYGEADTLTEEQLSSIRRTVKKNNASSIVLPAHLCAKETVQYLYDRQVNVWAAAKDTLSETECYALLLSGVVGVISDDTAALLKVGCEALPENTLTRAPLNIAHRGLMSEAPENTVEGSWAAYELGADVIELDIYLTTDGKLAVMHDSTTERTCNENLTVEKSTYAQLAELYVNKGFEDHPVYSTCRIPLLEDYFEAFKDTDCRFFVEVKSSKAAIVAPMKEVIEAYGYYDRCTVITGRAAVLEELRATYPEMAVSRLAKSGDAAHITENAADAGSINMMEIIGPYNASHGPYKVNYGPNALRAALIRGINVYPWTINNADTAAQDFADLTVWGYSGLTNNFAGMIGAYGKDVAVTGLPDTAYVGQSVTVGALLNQYDRKQKAVTPTVTVLSGAEAVTVDGATLTFREEGTVTLLIGGAFDANGETVTLFAQPIELTVESRGARYAGHQNTVEENGYYDIRLVGTVSEIEDVKSIAYAISVNGGAEKTVYLSYVYRSITTDFGTGSFTAPDGGYVVALQITDCPVDTQFNVRMITVYKDGTRATTATYSASYVPANP